MRRLIDVIGGIYPQQRKKNSKATGLLDYDLPRERTTAAAPTMHAIRMPTARAMSRGGSRHRHTRRSGREIYRREPRNRAMPSVN
jgi:hypothetical protein